MHTIFYASGFLYHSSTQQILLQHIDNSLPDTVPTLFTGKCKKGEDVTSGFQRIIKEALNITLPIKAIHEIYDREHDDVDADHFITFAEITDSHMKKLAGNATVSVIPLKKLPKVKIKAQTRQDIIVGQRVINLIERERSEENLQEQA